MPGTAVVCPETPPVISQSASASWKVWFAMVYVLSGESGRAGCATPGAGSAGTGTTSGCWRGHALGGTLPRIHVRTALIAQPDGSAVVVLCPTPGTTTRWPCGNRETTDCAPAVGVRMSKPPLTASIGTSGSGPVPSGAPPVGPGQPRQKSALPKAAAQGPNGPSVPAGRAATAAWKRAGRAETGVLGSHGNGPSRQTVAA